MAKRFKLNKNLEQSQHKSPSKTPHQKRKSVLSPSSSKNSTSKKPEVRPMSTNMFIRRLVSDGNSITYDKTLETSMLYPKELEDMIQRQKQKESTSGKKIGPRDIIPGVKKSPTEIRN
jgi:hypothetical protein